jgi:hypothetical protein
MNATICLMIAVRLFSSVTAAPGTNTYLPPRQLKSEKVLVGTINKTLKVQIKLSRNGKALSGSYSYERVGKALRLEGQMQSENEFYLNEFDEGGAQTGKFDGKFVTEDWIEGTWSAARTKKQLVFSAWDLNGKQIPSGSADDKISGEYRRVFRGRFDRDPATLNIWLLKDGRVRIAGNATWVGNVKTGNVNVGDVDGVFELHDRKILYNDADEDACRFTVTLGQNAITVTDDNSKCGGVNVSFDGEYRKVGPPSA